MSDYTLELDAGPLCGLSRARLIVGAGHPAAPVITGNGGFSAYRPLPELPPRSLGIVALEP